MSKGLTTKQQAKMVKWTESQPLPSFLTKTEIDTILDAAKIKNYRDFVFIMTLFRTGGRVSEIVGNKQYPGLKVDDIREDKVRLYGKGKKERWVPVTQDFLNVILSYIAAGNIKGKVFNMTTTNAWVILQKYEKVINRHLNPHVFRHSYAVYLLSQGLDVRYVQKLLGHSSILNTMIYLRITDANLEEAFKKVMW